jgi:hypothetical protein
MNNTIVGIQDFGRTLAYRGLTYSRTAIEYGAYAMKVTADLLGDAAIKISPKDLEHKEKDESTEASDEPAAEEAN